MIVEDVNNDTLILRHVSHEDTSTYPITAVREKVGENGSPSSAKAAVTD
ncbi:hypothetical protein [Halotia branconii]|uniref:Uncharacterized protein n=1 Tax=Halotia branconii CENA392 TaxID=1539056 RepID=A0AAJ6NN00_9CYAN|nr:hypothetical protein [Halotia branconii]WGV23391.1 hypothetical protein QI031_16320 [Halotia branconii CENA392]